MLIIPESATIAVPILEAIQGHLPRLLGTGFFVRKDSIMYLFTAKHVLEGYSQTRVLTSLFLDRGGSPLSHDLFLPLDGMISSPHFDICAIPVLADLPQIRPFLLDIDPDQIDFADSVSTYEYSGTISQPASPGQPAKVSFEPKFWNGNVLRYYYSTFPEKRPTLCMELSFAILRGASGSPVVRAKSRKVIGMLVASIGSQVQPAQIESIHDDQGKLLEEYKYFLPTSKALSGQILSEFFQTLD